MKSVKEKYFNLTRDIGGGRLVLSCKVVLVVAVCFALTASLNIPAWFFSLLGAVLLMLMGPIGITVRQRQWTMFIGAIFLMVLPTAVSVLRVREIWLGYWLMLIITFGLFYLARFGGRWIAMPQFVLPMVLVAGSIKLSLQESLFLPVNIAIAFLVSFFFTFFFYPFSKLDQLRSSIQLMFDDLACYLERSLLNGHPHPEILNPQKEVINTGLKTNQELLVHLDDYRKGQFDLSTPYSIIALGQQQIWGSCMMISESFHNLCSLKFVPAEVISVSKSFLEKSSVFLRRLGELVVEGKETSKEEFSIMDAEMQERIASLQEILERQFTLSLPQDAIVFFSNLIAAGNELLQESQRLLTIKRSG